SKKEHVREAGYVLLISLLRRGAAIEEEALNNYLKIIEKEIHRSPDRAKEAMNRAIIAIGVHRPHLAESAKNTAIKIGRVMVDRDGVAYKTPDAFAYIEKARAQR